MNRVEQPIDRTKTATVANKLSGLNRALIANSYSARVFHDSFLKAQQFRLHSNDFSNPKTTLKQDHNRSTDKACNQRRDSANGKIADSETTLSASPLKDLLALSTGAGFAMPGLAKMDKAPTAEQLLQSSRAQELRALIERCERFMLLNDKPDKTVKLLFSSALFPNLQFTLNKAGDSKGWVLSIAGNHQSDRRHLSSAKAALQDAFLKKGLGGIDIEV